MFIHPFHVTQGKQTLCPAPGKNPDWSMPIPVTPPFLASRASQVAQMFKNPPAMQEAGVQSLGWEDPLEKKMATHSNIFAWRIPWTEEPGRLQSMGSQESDTTERLPFLSHFLFFKPPSSKQPNPNHAGLRPASTLLPPLHGSTSGNIWLFFSISSSPLTLEPTANCLPVSTLY